jgi:hypothetical protein
VASVFKDADEGENFSSDDASFAAINSDDATVLYLIAFDYLNAVAEALRRQKVSASVDLQRLNQKIAKH